VSEKNLCAGDHINLTFKLGRLRPGCTFKWKDFTVLFTILPKLFSK